MIERYTRPEMKRIWEMNSRYQYWLDVELAACRALNQMGVIPAEDLRIILDKADFDPERILEIEKETRHDVIAFLTSVSEHVGAPSRWIHYGMTSSDVLDTATALQLKESSEGILSGLFRLGEVLRLRAREHKQTLCIGRSHGIHAEPTSFGLKFALWYDENQRNIARMEETLKIVSVGQISGAVGNYAHLSPEVEQIACEHLGLVPANVSTQVLQRDRHAQYCTTLAILASSIEKIAVEIRHLQRTEVLEAEEDFGKGQKGSSAMPHKKNPIVSEQLCGLARLVRNNAGAALENNALWHERDISHSSVERVILPDSSILVDTMLHKITTLVEHLRVFPERMKKNIELTRGLVFSQTLLLRLAAAGMSREDAYAAVQKLALQTWDGGDDFETLVREDRDLGNYLESDEMDEVFSYDRYLEHVELIYDRTGI